MDIKVDTGAAGGKKIVDVDIPDEEKIMYRTIDAPSFTYHIGFEME